MIIMKIMKMIIMKKDYQCQELSEACGWFPNPSKSCTMVMRLHKHGRQFYVTLMVIGSLSFAGEDKFGNDTLLVVFP